MALVNFKQSTEAKILSAPIADGTFYVSTDTNKLFLDVANKRIEVSANTNTTYSLTKSGNTVTLNGSDGSSFSITDANTTYGNATTYGSGLMSASDKSKLDGIAIGANKTTVDNELSSTSSNPIANKAVNESIQSLGTALNHKANSSHTHGARDITFGQFSTSVLPTIPMSKLSITKEDILALGVGKPEIAIQSSTPTDSNIKIWIQV